MKCVTQDKRIHYTNIHKLRCEMYDKVEENEHAKLTNYQAY